VNQSTTTPKMGKTLKGIHPTLKSVVIMGALLILRISSWELLHAPCFINNIKPASSLKQATSYMCALLRKNGVLNQLTTAEKWEENALTVWQTQYCLGTSLGLFSFLRSVGENNVKALSHQAWRINSSVVAVSSFQHRGA